MSRHQTVDDCPNCGAPLEYDEVDIGVGTLRGNPGCPECHWTPDNPREKGDDDGAEYSDPRDFRDGRE